MSLQYILVALQLKQFSTDPWRSLYLLSTVEHLSFPFLYNCCLREILSYQTLTIHLHSLIICDAAFWYLAVINNTHTYSDLVVHVDISGYDLLFDFEKKKSTIFSLEYVVCAYHKVHSSVHTIVSATYERLWFCFVVEFALQLNLIVYNCISQFSIQRQSRLPNLICIIL